MSKTLTIALYGSLLAGCANDAGSPRTVLIADSAVPGAQDDAGPEAGADAGHDAGGDARSDAAPGDGGILMVDAGGDAATAKALLSRPLQGSVVSSEDQLSRPLLAQVLHEELVSNSGARPIVAFLPGWAGSGDVPASASSQAERFARAGYVTVSLGLHEVSAGDWHSDLAESTKAALDLLCVDGTLPVQCGFIALVGSSYGGTQAHPVIRYLRASGYDGTTGREAVAFLSQDAGYTLYYAAPRDAQLDRYSVAMIENLGDTSFPVNGCAYDNCGAANRVRLHLMEAPAQVASLLSYCPPGGEHGVRSTYAAWDDWVLDAVKTMLHTQQAAPVFAGYQPPVLAVGPNGIGAEGRCVP